MLLAENMTGASARFPVPENHYRTKRGAELSKYPPAEPRFDGCGYLIVAGSQPEGKFRISNKEFRTAEARPIRTSKFNIPCSIFCGSKCPFFQTRPGRSPFGNRGKANENVKLLLGRAGRSRNRLGGSPSGKSRQRKIPPDRPFKFPDLLRLIQRCPRFNVFAASALIC